MSDIRFTAVHARRLLKLADFLDELPRERFDYARYVGEDFGGAQDLSCGTTACALGWATAMPEFRRLGARFVGRGGYAQLGLSDDPGSSEESVSARLFGLNSDEHDELFVPGDIGGGGAGPPSDSTAKRVAKHIREWVARKTAAKS